MKTRIISALVGTVILLAVLFCPYEWVFVLVAAALAAIAVWELLNNTGLVNSRLLTWVGVVFAATEIIAVGCACRFTVEQIGGFYIVWLPLCLPMIYCLLAVLTMLMKRKTMPFKSAVCGFALTLYATLGFGSLAALRAASFGSLAVVLLLLVIAWMSDTGAYFTGVLFGKHKMAPVISPKKTWEGFFGGWAFSVACAALLAVICTWAYNGVLVFHAGEFALFAAIFAPLSVLGDLFASLIKRRCGIKDYGNLMPGHGGVMDRFDSVVFIAPLLCAVLSVAQMK